MFNFLGNCQIVFQKWLPFLPPLYYTFAYAFKIYLEFILMDSEKFNFLLKSPQYQVSLRRLTE